MIAATDPRGWWLAAAAAAGVLVLLFRWRRRRVALSTFFLLRRIAERLAFLPRRVRVLRRVSLLLFLAAIACLVLAGFRPAWRSDAPRLRVLALVDLSPSLGALDGGRPRQAQLRALLSQLAGHLQPGDAVHVVLAGPRPEVSTRLDGPEVRAWLGAAEPRDAPADVDAALAQAAAIAAREQPDLALLVTDLPARWEEAAARAGGDLARWRVLAFGAPRDNTGIVAFDVRPDPRRPGRHDLYARVAHHGAAARAFTLRVVANDRELRSFSRTAPPGGEQEFLVAGLELPAGWVEARLEPADAWPADDAARAGVAARGAVRVVLVSPGNRFLGPALEASPAVRLERVAPGEPLPRAPDAVHVFDTLVPEGELPARALFILPDRDLEGLGQSAYLPPPTTITAVEGEPVLRGVSLERLSLRGQLAFEGSAAFRGVAAGDGRPLVLLGEDPRRRWAVLAFDPSQTSFVYTPSYPVLVGNLVEWLSAFSRGERGYFAAGEEVHLPPAAAGGTFRLPDGESVWVPPGAMMAPFPRAGRAGRYRVQAADGRGLGEFYVNTVSAAASAAPALAGYGRGGAELPAALERPPLRLDLTPWLVLAALALLALEAFVRPGAVSARQ